MYVYRLLIITVGMQPESQVVNHDLLRNMKGIFWLIVIFNDNEHRQHTCIFETCLRCASVTFQITCLRRSDTIK